VDNRHFVFWLDFGGLEPEYVPPLDAAVGSRGRSSF